MKKIRLRLCMLFAILLTTSQLIAQIAVTGTVTDSDFGDPLPGVNVVVTGTTQGTVTDIDGKFNINVPNEESELTFTYVGMQSQTKTVGEQRIMDITLSTGELLQEVVVTGFIPDRNERQVTYASQTVEVEKLLSQPNKNALEALRGKIAGVKINTGSGSVGASTRIVVRGESSLTGNNNALIVVDGVPIDNSTSQGGQGGASSGYADYGNRFNDINPNDIESITRLSGPAATALYGSRGSSGVVVITTKSGKGVDDKKTMSYGINSRYSREQAYVLLQRQDQFGQGFEGTSFDSGENWSWGPAVDGVSRPWTSPVDSDGDGDLEFLSRPYSAVENQIQNFFQTGQTFENSLFLSGATDGFTYYGSYSNLSQEGVLENTTYNRNTFNFKGSAQLSKKLSTNFGFNYAGTILNTAQEGYRPFEGQNAYANAIQAPITIPYNEVRDYTSPFHDLAGWYGSYSSNPYFILNEYLNEGKFNNFLANLGLKYNLTDDLNITANVGFNQVNRTIETATPIHTPPEQLVWVNNLGLTTRNTRNGSLGEYSKQLGKNTNYNVTTMANYRKELDSGLNFGVSVGYDLFDRRSESVTGEAVEGLVVPGWFNLRNSQQAPRSDQFVDKYRLYGVLGNVSIGWKNQIFLEYSARNDWSSTLPKDDNSFFYNGVGLSIVVSDMLGLQDNNFLNYLKLRGGIGTTGKDAQTYQIEGGFIGSPTIQTLNQGLSLTTPILGQSAFTVSNFIGNPNLRPELTNLFEVGADVGLFRDRITLQYTYYVSNHNDQIITVGLPASTGFTSTTSNIGEMTNKGHEIQLNLKPIQGLVNDLKWDIDLMYTKNTNEVINISEDQDEIVIGGPYTNGSISLVAKEGLPFGTYKSRTPKIDEATGKMIVSANGFPELTEEDEYFGAYQPDFTASAASNLSYKGIGINVLFDFRQGGQFLSITKDQTEFNGTALTTIAGDRQPFIIDGLKDDGEGNLIPNDVEVTAEQLYAVSGVSYGGSSLLIDASFVKLRELGLSYNVPSKLLKKTPISRASINLYGSNLKFWLPEENTYADPEINGSDLAGNAVGVETTQTPPSKSYGVRIGLTF